MKQIVPIVDHLQNKKKTTEPCTESELKRAAASEPSVHNSVIFFSLQIPIQQNPKTKFQNPVEDQNSSGNPRL